MKFQIPRISTRGFYDLDTGKALKTNSYCLYPKKSFVKLYGKKEITIVIHGLRNNKRDSLNKFFIAKRRLKKIGYVHNVIGFSYDSNTKGAHIKKYELRALRTGEKIAKKNGKHLSQFIQDFKNKSPDTKIRLIGHSLGTTVILSTVKFLAKKSKTQHIIESVHFFGASIQNDIAKQNISRNIFNKIIRSKIVNYYSTTDEVLTYAYEHHQLNKPLGLLGFAGKPNSKFIQRKVHPKNHRFVNYANTLRTFP